MVQGTPTDVGCCDDPGPRGDRLRIRYARRKNILISRLGRIYCGKGKSNH